MPWIVRIGACGRDKWPCVTSVQQSLSLRADMMMITDLNCDSYQISRWSIDQFFREHI